MNQKCTINQNFYFSFGNKFDKILKAINTSSQSMDRTNGENSMPTSSAGYPANQPYAMYSPYPNYPSGQLQQPYSPNKMQQFYKQELYLQSTQPTSEQNVPIKKTNVSSDQPKGFGFSNESIRRGFIRKIFGILSVSEW